MTDAVILTKAEWDALPAKIGRMLARQARGEIPGGGFTVVSKETGEPIIDRLDDWFVGSVVFLMSDIVAEMRG